MCNWNQQEWKENNNNKNFDAEEQKKQTGKIWEMNLSMLRWLNYKKGLQRINRHVQPGKPMPSKSGKYISDVMLQNVVLTCPEGLEKIAGKRQEATLTELWDSWMKDVITLNGRGWVSQDIRLCHNQGELFKADVYTLGKIVDLIPVDAIHKSRLNSFLLCYTF